MATSAEFEFCTLTAPGRGAVAVIAIAGPGAAHALAEYFISSSARLPTDLQTQRIYHGRWAAAQGEEIVVCRSAAEEFEIHCHGGLAAVSRIAHDLESIGGARVEERAWLARRMANSIEQDAWLALAAARTERTANVLLDQCHGALTREIEQVLTDCRQRHFDAACERLQLLAERAALGRHLVAPFDVVLAGPPNVGKSSLINALVGYKRAIVYDAPGTTRDVITADTAIDGWPVTLSDTAGLRDSDDPLESAGVQRALARLQSADLIVLLFDACQPMTAPQRRLVEDFPAALTALTKCDLQPGALQPGSPDGMLRTSAVTGAGLGELLAAISDRLVPDPPRTGVGVAFTTAQCRSIEDALAAVRHSDSALAIELLSGLVARPPA
ncbi:MAG TPA: GTPase [Pirellulales bacterium]|nr:GTPase [Pirellulales bacterium]